MVRRLCVFDFDGTVFKSPEPSAQIWGRHFSGVLGNPTRSKGLGWYQDPLTLSPPYVPEMPEASWLVEETLPEVRAALADPETRTVLLTGRTTRYEERVRSICEHLGIAFAAFGLKPQDFHGSTMAFKQQWVLDELATCGARFIAMWDDRKHHVQQFRAFLADLVRRGTIDAFEVHHIDAQSRPFHLEPALERELVRRLQANAPPSTTVLPEGLVDGSAVWVLLRGLAPSATHVLVERLVQQQLPGERTLHLHVRRGEAELLFASPASAHSAVEVLNNFIQRGVTAPEGLRASTGAAPDDD